jgi:hypothetical protein
VAATRHVFFGFHAFFRFAFLLLAWSWLCLVVGTLESILTLVQVAWSAIRYVVLKCDCIEILGANKLVKEGLPGDTALEAYLFEGMETLQTGGTN